MSLRRRLLVGLVVVAVLALEAVRRGRVSEAAPDLAPAYWP